MKYPVFLVLVGLCLVATGCTRPTDAGDPKESLLSGWVIQDLVRAKAPLTVKQANAILPKPEQVMAVSALPEFLKGQSGWNNEVIANAMDGMYRGFLWSEKQRRVGRMNDLNWQSDKSFLGCSVWLYGWDKPQEITLGGILPRKTGIVASSYLLVEDDTVVDSGPLTRPKGSH